MAPEIAPFVYEPQRIVEENYSILNQLTLEENLHKAFQRKNWTKYYHSAIVLLCDNFLTTNFDDLTMKTLVDYVVDIKVPTFFYIGPEQKCKKKTCPSCMRAKFSNVYGRKRWLRDEIC